ncbi:hypothetical protein M405DRAFT_906247, partial [Rhizopogon salebrosus TDB-379]
YLGLFKLVRDYSNNSFLVDLPSYLKQWECTPFFMHRYFAFMSRTTIGYFRDDLALKPQT